MHAFDPRSILLARHAQHVVLVHFPIALFLTGVACDFASRWRPGNALRTVARVNILLAAVSTLPVLLTGLLAWWLQFPSHRLHGMALLHLSMAVIACVLIWTVVLTRRWTSTSPRAHKALELAAALAVVMTAHIGGFLSGVNSVA